MKTTAAITMLLIAITYGSTIHPSAETAEKQKKSLTDTICEIRKLESNRDPKCHATATRLENFMYGTTLSAETRFLKVKLQKKILKAIWQRAGAAFNKASAGINKSDYFKKEIAAIVSYYRKKGGDIVVGNQKKAITLNKVDIDHYFSVAYSLRTILALQQETLFQKDPNLIPLDPPTISLLKEFLDIYTLSVLQAADRMARLQDKYQITPGLFEKAWTKIQKHPLKNQASTELTKAAAAGKTTAGPASARFATVNAIIDQKIKSYEAYNNISMQVFLRNLQVYFARHRWPKDPGESRKFKVLFTESMIAFATRSLLYAGKTAAAAGHQFIREDDVDKMWKTFVPFDVNEYEDIIFFPRLATPEKITIESYDFDAFRDSGIHWRYLQSAIKDADAGLEKEPDPFAAELLVEGIAQYGVLLLRVAGNTAKEKGDERLKVAHLEQSLKDILHRIEKHRKAKAIVKNRELPTSSSGITQIAPGKTYFSDVTPASRVDFMHRSSDWLSRMLRSFLKQSATKGTLTIPPAFGGSGAAAGDINGDGFDDLLLLSGSGNALYLSGGNGTFRDVTEEAGIVFKRPDGNPGEPRQPIIADLDNDGNQDILITYVNDNHKLYKGRGDGTFVDVSAASGLQGKNKVGGPACVFDYNRDGLLDIYIAYFGDYLHGHLPMLARVNRNGLSNKLFKNKGGMRFEDVTQKSGTGDTGWGQAAAHTDLDADGWQDLIVGNDFGVNTYYRNKKNGTFENIAAQLKTGKPSFTMSVGLADLNRDGFPDIYISNIVTLVKDEKYVLPGAGTTMKFDPGKLARMRIIEANDLFISQKTADQTLTYFSSEAVGRGYSSTGWAWDADFFDFDNDGDDDLYCVNGMNEYAVYSDTPYYTELLKGKKGEITIPVYEKESNVFFVNQGGKLENQSKISGTDYLGNSRSTVYMDIENDGDLDIILNNYHGPARVYRNNTQRLKNNWLKLKLVGDPGKKSNRDAIGSVIVAYNNQKQIAWREIHAGHGYLSMDSKIQHIGLGKKLIAHLKITWPNGEITTHKGVKANALHTIRQ
ncbi:MAG: RNA-binding protein [bacterium]|nr:RNA-binding protein [bacterium]